MALRNQNDVWEIFSLMPSAIGVPTDYGRTDVGDVAGLAASIDNLGLLSPILVHIDEDGDYVLRAGLRRLRACEQLGWQVVPVLAVDHLPTATGAAMVAFRDENTQRKALTPSEAVRVADVIEAWMRPILAMRRRAGVKAGPCENFPQGAPKSRDIAAGAVGYSAPTITKARTLLSLAESAELTPEVRKQVRKKVELMDSTGNVSRALREARALVVPADVVNRDAVPSLRQAWARAGTATEAFAVALNVAVEALARDIPGPDASIDDADLDAVEAGARRALDLVAQVRKSRLRAISNE